MLDASTGAPNGKPLTRPAIAHSLSLADGQFIEVDFAPDEDSVEISLVESCGAVSGSVFVPVNHISRLIKQLRLAVQKM